jgi:hypothetical protein
MTITRTKDPAGLGPDLIRIVHDGKSSHEEITAALREIAEIYSLSGRVARLRRHPRLQSEADKLEARFDLMDLGGMGWRLLSAEALSNRLIEISNTAGMRLLARLASAEAVAVYLDASPKVIRDRSRQDGTHRLRGSRMPELDSWLDGADVTRTNAELFASLPSSDDDSDLYRDGDTVVEVQPTGNQRAVTRAGFDKRVTAARKRR